MFGEFGINAGYVEDLHAQYLQNPASVPDGWRAFFEGRTGAPGNGPPSSRANGNGTNGVHSAGVPYLASGASPAPGWLTSSSQVAGQGPAGIPSAGASDSLFAAVGQQGKVYALVNAYRVRGHLFAHLDPLGGAPSAKPELELANFGFSEADLEKTFPTMGLAGLPDRATLREIVAHLSRTYCQSIGVEYTHIEDPDQRNWLQEAMESTGNRADLENDELLRILTKLTDAEIFEQFIHKNHVGAKRFSLEGAESMIAMLDLLVEEAGEHGVQEIVLGMAHRGRLNVLVNVLGKNARDLFAAFFDAKPERFLGSGDVKYHLGYSNDVKTRAGRTVHLSLTFNPSHLEFVNPIVEGRVRAKQDRQKRASVMPLLIHGDAAFAGQGVVPETLNLAGLAGYTTGGTIHLVVNNQIGFTTNPQDARSTRYCTDIARMIRVPVFHVNGEDPEAVIQVTRLAIEFRQRYGKDVVIDMYCYRKYGHNETDEPRFTQPVMYAQIDKKPTVRQMYVQRLAQIGVIDAGRAEAIVEERRKSLDEAHAEAKKGDFHHRPNAMEGLWSPYKGGPDNMAPEVSTAVDKASVTALATKLAQLPEGFKANAKVADVLARRRAAIVDGKPFDWGTAEHLAFASLLANGHGVRLSGQDARRGTFTHRHAVLYESNTGAAHCPLMGVAAGGAKFEVYDSPLSEAGVLGFDYGYSLDCPDALVLWEAQFGDFLNGAQVIVDQFIASAEDKWMRLSGIVLLLPHGYEGQGPEHSSARIERFLQMSAEDNIQVVNLTTPAQYFHVLRRQVLRPWRKPLVVFTPKSLLRHPSAVSTVDDLTRGEFQRVIPDATADAAKVKRVLLCSGKVYYELAEARRARARDDVAIVRLEQYYPFSDALAKALGAYKKGTQVMWVQEEPRNMGAWYFMHARWRDMAGGDAYPLALAARAESASPATGSNASHQLEQKILIDEAFAT